ncbi:hypothetical protein BUALT_Bualt16G0121000 [Buddleja alternifolia]|uniref:Uncharacterized protein n=1 Tax=Buddleja alternifolia TaxID=168488 RepID=A0AAV6W8Z4_9LAMI|nr:hypothetical protein BUALT_Bualt16G0121000 [Buddleja alternifolia]
MGYDQSFILPLLIIIVFSLTPFLTSSLDDNYEYGYDFKAYPSYFTPIEGIKFDNTVKIDKGAFQNSWNEACSSSAYVSFVVPQRKTYLLKPISHARMPQRYG